MKQVTFNLNMNIGVMLTEHGVRRYTESEGVAPNVYDGITYIVGWKLFDIFGDMIWHGNPNLPFSMNVVITVPEKEIKDA